MWHSPWGVHAQPLYPRPRESQGLGSFLPPGPPTAAELGCEGHMTRSGGPAACISGRQASVS